MWMNSHPSPTFLLASSFIERVLHGTSLVVQQLRHCLLMLGVRVQSLVRELGSHGPLVLVTQLCLTLCSPTDYSSPGSSVHEILQARILEWVAISFSKGSSLPRDWTHISLGLMYWQAGSLPLAPPGKILHNIPKWVKVYITDKV